MRQLEFSATGWLAGGDGDPSSRFTLAPLTIKAGPEAMLFTEVEDTVIHTVRDHIYVPLYPVAIWLLANWWRLRWEPRPTTLAHLNQWRQVHSMSAIGMGYAWPAIEFSSDGEFIQLQLEAEETTDASAIRYLNSVVIDVPAADFEAAVDALADHVEARLRECVPAESDLRELRAELLGERSDPDLARACRLQALAGIDAGEASRQWLQEVSDLGERIGAMAADEVMAVLPSLKNGLATATSTIEAIINSPTMIDLSAVSQSLGSTIQGERPWERGERIAAEFRKHLTLSSGPISDQVLGDILGIRLPLSASPETVRRSLRGVYRTNGRAHVQMRSHRVANQRFDLARIIGGAIMAPSDQKLLPVTAAGTAFQKFERSFAQELLCPWHELDAFTDEHGVDEDAIADAAEYFDVSEDLVITTLVNRKKVPRARLPQR